MQRLNRCFGALIGLFAALLIAVPIASPAGASAYQHDDHRGVVFVQTDNVAGNQVVAYDRSANGTLTQAGVYGTGGLGGVLDGSVADHVASQGSLVADGDLLYAVNPGSNTVAVFSVRGDRLQLRQVVGSGGTFPVSVTVHDHLVYVLNARDGGSVQGFARFGDHLFPIGGSNRALGLDPTATPEFTHTPGQVAFTPDGSQLLVTTKGNTSAVDVFRVRWDGRLSASPVVTSLPGLVPFAVSFDRAGHAVITNAGPSTVTVNNVNRDGTLTQLESDATGQAATCWVVRVGNRFYVSNAGSSSLTGFQPDRSGHLTNVGNTSTDAGSVDAAATPRGDFLYVQTGVAGLVDGFAVNRDGSLTSVGSVTVPGAAGGEGIVAL
jgi:6-phosphogluconolactonase (cycloisomerase 2 family)